MGPSRRCIAMIAVIAALLCAIRASADEKTYEAYGTLTYPDGAPAAGVRIIWQRMNECKENEVTTDAEGNYRVEFQGRAGRNYAGFSAQQGDYALSDSVSVPDGTGKPVRKDLRFEFAALVVGDVTDERTGEPISDAKVNIYGSYGAETTTNADGLFKVRVLPRLGLMLNVKKTGYVTSQMDFSAQSTYVTGWRVKLKRGGIVRGRVTDTSGQPVAAIAVGITEFTCYFRWVKTDQDGRYELRDVDPDRSAELRVDDVRLPTSQSRQVEFPKGAMETTCDFAVELANRELRSITGRVTTDTGVPVEGAKVRFGKGTCWGEAKETVTDANGSYSLSGLAPDRNLILVQADGYAPSFMPVDEGDQQTDVTLSPAHSAELLIVGPRDEPLPSVSVTVNTKTPVLGRLYPDSYGSSWHDLYRWLYTTVTDENGRVVLKNIPAEGVLVHVYKKDYAAPNDTVIRVDSTDNLIKMQGMPQVAGTVLDAATGNPVQCFTVKWESEGAQSVAGDDSMAFNRTDGKFIVQVGDSRFITARRFIVRVLADGYVGEQATITSTDAPTADYGNIFRLQKTFATKARVVDDNGKGIPGAKVTIVENRGYLTFMVPPQIARTAYSQDYSTADDGGFTIDPVRERIGTAIVEKTGYPRFVDQNVDLTKPLTLTLHAAATLNVKAETMAREKATLDVSQVKNRCWTGLPDKPLPPDGRASYADLEPGDYVIVLRGAGHTELRAVTLEPGQTTTVDIDRERKSTVTGVITRKGVPVPDVTVSIQRGINTYSSDSKSDAQGRYSVGVEEPGPASLTHYQRKGQEIVGRMWRSIDVQPGENTIDIRLPYGSVSGRVIDDKTGQPTDGARVEAWGKWTPTLQYDMAYTQGGFGESLGTTVTAKDGTFTLADLPDGPVVPIVTTKWQRSVWTGSPITVSEEQPVEGFKIRLQKPGALGVSVVDSKTCKTLPAQITLQTHEYALIVTDNRYTETTSVPAGSYILCIEPLDAKHLPTQTDVTVKPGKTTKLTVKLNPCRQRIVFRIEKGGKFESLRWYDKDPPRSPSASLNVLDMKEDIFKGRPWIGFKISDAATGKPVLMGRTGPKWGGELTSFDSQREAALPVKPGRYAIDAVLRNKEDYAVASESNLWKGRQVLTVTEGKDSIIEVR